MRDMTGRPTCWSVLTAMGAAALARRGHGGGVMAADHRIMAGADLDRLFVLMRNASRGRGTTREEFWWHLRGWRRSPRPRASGHRTCTDLSPLMRQLDRALPLPPEAVDAMTDAIGTITADRAVVVGRAWQGAFFDLHRRCRDRRVLSGPSQRFPEIEFVP
ncbi:hypothetical protein ACFVY1_37575 [Streptomyces sp. NPDC058293]|uniref:hypothetical protein n=1 Tax=Streptomyces sp. NPDC058293 TaxID=3346429 RepID=UPI0036E6649E